MVAKKTPQFPEYTPIGNEISMSSALVQAAIALDRAGKYADETKNVEQLTQIALVWIEMGSRLDSSPEEGEEEEGEDVTGSYPLGFASPGADAEVKRKREENASKSKG